MKIMGWPFSSFGGESEKKYTIVDTFCFLLEWMIQPSSFAMYELYRTHSLNCVFPYMIFFFQTNHNCKLLNYTDMILDAQRQYVFPHQSLLQLISILPWLTNIQIPVRSLNNVPFIPMK